MTNKRKLEEVQYYLDRMSDAALKIIRSVAENPSLLDVEKEIYLKEIAADVGQQRGIAAFADNRFVRAAGRSLLQHFTFEHAAIDR